MRRVCPYFIRFSSSFVLFLALLLLCLLPFMLVVFLCPLALSFFSWFVFVVSFSLSVYAQKERAQFLASSLRVLWVIDLVGVRFPVLVKFVTVSINLFGDTFIR